MRTPLSCLLLFSLLLLSLVAQSAGARDGSDTLLLADFELGDVSSFSSVTPGPPPVPADAFRFSLQALRDPHVFVDLGPLGCTDITDVDVPLLSITSINNSLAQSISSDGDDDGCLDLSTMLLFRPLDPLVDGELVDSRGGRCAPPAASTTCSVDSTIPKSRVSYNNLAAGTCLGAVVGSTSLYTPPVLEAVAPCFVTAPRLLVLEVGAGIFLPLRDFQTAGTYLPDPGVGLAVGIGNGLSRGFLREVDADAVHIPKEFPVLGGMPVSILFRGGTNNCALGDDRDEHMDELGWWVYMNFSADRVPWIGL